MNNNQTEEKLPHIDMISKRVSFTLKQFDSTKKKEDGRKKLIEELNKTNDDLAKKLHIMTSAESCLKEMEYVKKLTLLTQDMEFLDSQLKKEKSYINDLEKLLQQTENQKLKLSNKKEIFKNSTSHLVCGNKNIDKSKEMWKEKLHVASCHLGCELTKNSELKEKIKSFMSERKSFNEEYNNLLEKLKSGKKVMETLTTSLNDAYYLRDNITSKIEVISSKEKRQLQLQVEEVQTLEMRRDCETALKKFYLVKAKPRSVNTIYKKKYTVNEDMLAENEKFQRTIEVILQMCEETSSKKLWDLKDVIAMFQKENSIIMSLFNYITQQNLEVELREGVKTATNTIQYWELVPTPHTVAALVEVLKECLVNQERHFTEVCLKEEEKQFLHEVRKINLNNYKENLEISRYNMIEEKNNCLRNLNKLYSGIQILIFLTKTDVTSLLLLLGKNDKVTDFNYNLFLQAIETSLIRMLEATGLSRVSPTFAPVKSERTKTMDSQGGKSFSKSIMDSPEHKILITIPCQQCFPPDVKIK